MSGSGGSCVASLILCSTISSSYSSLDPLCYDHQLTGLYLVRQLTINSLLIRQYIQSITSTQTCKVSSLTEVTLTHLVNASSLRRSTDVPTPFHRLATIAWIQSHHLQGKFKSLAGKGCWQHPSMFCLYTSSKLSRPQFWIFTECEGVEIKSRLPFKSFYTSQAKEIKLGGDQS